MARTERSAKRTTDHDQIRRWVEARGGHPAAVKRTGRGDDPGILRIDFPGFSGEGTLEAINWDTFFDWFDRNELAFIYQDVDSSRFNKLVSRSGRGRRGAKLAHEESSRRTGGEKRTDGRRERRGPNAIRLLEQQHREVEALFSEYDEAEEGKQELFEEIADSLAAHSEIEEKIFYPSFMADRTADELRESVEEHLAVKRLLADLMKMKPSDPQFDPKVQLVEELMRHHIEQEEHRLFPQIERLDPKAMESLGEMMKSTYEDLIEKEPRKLIPKETGSAAPLPS